MKSPLRPLGLFLHNQNVPYILISNTKWEALWKQLQSRGKEIPLNLNWCKSILLLQNWNMGKVNTYYVINITSYTK